MPRDIIITKTVYKFDELEEEAQQKALERLSDINVDYDGWHEHIFAWFADEKDSPLFNLDETGLKYVSCSYSGFWSQGDGASVEFEVDDKAKYINFLISDYGVTSYGKPDNYKPMFLRAVRRYLKWCPDAIDCDGTTERRLGHYYTDYRPIEFQANEGLDQRCPWLKRIVEELNENADSHKSDVDSKAYRTLEKEYEYATSEEAIKETIDANEYEFTVDGRLA